MKRIMSGIAALTVAIAFTVPAVAATKKANKPVQAQTSSCNKCEKKKAAKAAKRGCNCNKPDCKNCNKRDCKNCSKAKDCKCNMPDCKNCNKTKNGTPCPTDCPKKSK